MSRTYDNWERLVAATLKRDQLWQLFHQQSRSPSIRSEASDFSSSSSSFSSPLHDVASTYWDQNQGKVRPKLVLVSEFSPPLDVADLLLVSSKYLGRGAFGRVYTAEIFAGAKIVVRRLKPSDISELDFERHMETVRNVKHENVVALRAYYCSEDARLMLYDHYRSGSLHALLHGQAGENRTSVDWETRLRIAIGAAKGIAEIHARNGGSLVHGNIKSSNIFLNSIKYGCVSDLGLTDMMGTKFMPADLCYAPEVRKTFKVSQSSDVYSFGILILELLTRKSAIAKDLVKLVTSIKSKLWAAKVFDADLLRDPEIKGQMVKMLQVGISCVAKSHKKRPRISEVVKMLEDVSITTSRLENTSTSSRLENTPSSEKLALVFVGGSKPTFDLEEILKASAEVLGKGTFGTSYKAVMYNGETVAVKRLKDVIVTPERFQQQMEVIGNIKHENVAKLKAYHYSRDEKFLVFDYYSQGSVSALLHGKFGAAGVHLDWETRLKIAIGAARGIVHVHKQDEEKLVHGNIKSSNIFLNEQGYGLISDFGLVQLASPFTWSSRIEIGYFAPEVNVGGIRKLSQSSDVYSFGVVLLELVSGKPSQHTSDVGEIISLVTWVQSVIHDEWVAEVFDAELLRYEKEDAMMQLLQIGMDCVATESRLRPTMAQVAKMLEEISGIDTMEQSFDEARLENPSVEPQLENPSVEPRLENPSVESRLEDLLEDLLPRLTP